MIDARTPRSPSRRRSTLKRRARPNAASPSRRRRGRVGAAAPARRSGARPGARTSAPLGVAAVYARVPASRGRSHVSLRLGGSSQAWRRPSGTAAAAAEAWIGAARGVRTSSSSRVASTPPAASSATASRSPAGAAARLRRLAVAQPGRARGLSEVGCLEAEVAAAGIVRRLIWRIKAGDHRAFRMRSAAISPRSPWSTPSPRRATATASPSPSSATRRNISAWPRRTWS